MPVDPLPLHLVDAGVRAGGQQLLTGVQVQVADGEAVAVLGANGSGKSTLIRAALGLVPITEGDATIFGVSTTRARTRVPWHRIGYVPQRLATNSPVPATAYEVVQTGLLGAGRLWLRRSDRHRVLGAMDRLGVLDLADRPFGVLSGGQAQRVVIARALVRDPELLLLDEPLAGVDVLTQTNFATLLARLHADGRTIVMVLHELGPFAELIDRGIVLSGGRIVQDGALPRDHGHAPSEQADGLASPHEHLHAAHSQPAAPPTQRSLP
ncbi:MAG: metal ABC transporter ATP-binding protein [Beutenbergiaceae bacterium]